MIFNAVLEDLTLYLDFPNHSLSGLILRHGFFDMDSPVEMCHSSTTTTTTTKFLARRIPSREDPSLVKTPFHGDVAPLSSVSIVRRRRRGNHQKASRVFPLRSIFLVVDRSTSPESFSLGSLLFALRSFSPLLLSVDDISSLQRCCERQAARTDPRFFRSLSPACKKGGLSSFPLLFYCIGSTKQRR